jgi:hypothetical protein
LPFLFENASVALMTKLKVPENQLDKFEGQWVVIDPQKRAVIAASKELENIGHLAKREAGDERPTGTVPYAFKVPRKDEGPYVL